MGQYLFATQDMNNNAQPLAVYIRHNQATCTGLRWQQGLGDCDYNQAQHPEKEWTATSDAKYGRATMSLFGTTQNHYFVARHSSGAQATNNAKDEGGVGLLDGANRYTIGLNFYL